MLLRFRIGKIDSIFLLAQLSTMARRREKTAYQFNLTLINTNYYEQSKH